MANKQVMSEEELLSTYDILTNDDMVLAKKSIINLIGADYNKDLTSDRGRFVEAFDENASETGDDFFYDMLSNLTFILNKEDVAYTTPDKIICLNYTDEGPAVQMVPQDNDKLRRWYFIYCHECLHQLWDTFGVAKEIAEQDGSYDHNILNIASDCVINDYLDKVDNDRKLRPVGGVFPDVLKKDYNIEYNRNVDTQYTMYKKLMALKGSLKDKLNENFPPEDFDGKKIGPKKINKQNGGGPTPPPQPKQDISPDFRKGWIQGIKDVLKQKDQAKDNDDLLDRIKTLNPMDNMPKDVKDTKEYVSGYKAALKNITKGLTDGIELSDGQGGNGSDDNSLPQIPWDLPQQNGNGGSGSGKGSNNNSQKDPTDLSKQAADAAQKAADKAKEIADKTDSKEAHDAANAAQQAADEAKEAAKETAKAAASGDSKKTTEGLQKAANAARKAGEELNKTKKAAGVSDKDTNDKGKGAGEGEKTDKNADGEKQNSSSGQNGSDGKTSKDNASDSVQSDIDTAAKAAEDAINSIEHDADGNNNNNNNGNSSSSKGGEGASGGAGDSIFTKEELDAAKSRGERVIRKYSDSLSGPLGDFIKQCKMSKKLNDGGLVMQAPKGSQDWPKELDSVCTQYVNQKLKNKKLYKTTYEQLRRGERAFSGGDFGRRAIMQGRKEKRQKIGFDMAVYIDTSGSMGGLLDDVFDAAYDIIEGLKKKFGKNQNVDKNQLDLKSYIFTTKMKEITWGHKYPAGDSTYAFHDLLDDIFKRNQNAFLNIVITDGDFNGINENQVCKTLNQMEGLFVIVCNKEPLSNGKGYFDDLVKAVKSNCGPKLYAIYADSKFSIPDKK